MKTTNGISKIIATRIMKNLFKSSMLVAIVAAAFVGCSKDATSDIENVTSGNTVTVNFDASVEDETRATLTPNDGETAFAAAWEDGDKIGIYAYALENDAQTYTKDNVKGTRTGNEFEATFAGAPAEIASAEYCAYYPYTTATGTLIPFGSERTQIGNNYNSAYDIMISDKVNVDREDGKSTTIGKDADGHAIVFPMKRQTAIAYFHFTTDDEKIKDEKVVSAKLSVTGANIAAETIKILYNTDKNTISLGAPTNTTNNITISFDTETAPTAADFTAWFNVLPCTFESMTLELETENYTAKILRNAGATSTYEAGKLYKVSGNLTKWQPKTEDYSGTYLILAKPATGNYWYLVPKANNDYQPAMDTNTAELGDFSDIATDENAWVVVKNGDKYIISSLSLSNSENRFIGGAASGKSNYAKLVAEGSAESVNITKKDDGTYLIATTSLSTTKYLALNTSVTPKRFAFYNEQTRNLVLIPYVSTPKIAPSVPSVTVSPVAGSYEDITYKTPGFETTPVVTATCDSAIVTAVEVVGNTIKYTVSANTEGKERTGTITLSAYGAESVTINVIQQSNVLDVPKNLSASGTVDAITASWNKVEHATAYAWELYKGTDNETGTRVNDVNGNIVTNDNDNVVTLTITKKDASTKFEVGQYVLYVKSTADAPFVESAPAKSEPFEIKDASAEPEIVGLPVSWNIVSGTAPEISSNKFYSSDNSASIEIINASGTNLQISTTTASSGTGIYNVKFPKNGYWLFTIPVKNLTATRSITFTAGTYNNASQTYNIYYSKGKQSWTDTGKTVSNTYEKKTVEVSATFTTTDIQDGYLYIKLVAQTATSSRLVNKIEFTIN